MPDKRTTRDSVTDCTHCGKPLSQDPDDRAPMADPLLEGRFCHPLCWYVNISVALKSALS